jgi:cardiolipin synthase
MQEEITSDWPALAALGQIVVALFVSGHVILHKRDVRAAIGWVGLVWLVPLIGSGLYALFGINRIRRRASELRLQRAAAPALPLAEALHASYPEPARHLFSVEALLDRVTAHPLCAGNRVEPLAGGTRAYAAMITAIDAARHSVGLASYIFDPDACGQTFVDALERAKARGIAVRVLIDGVGVHYGRPPVSTLLQRLGIPVALFLPTVFPMHLAYANLRNHRKILAVDGRLAFAGGMNIRSGHLDGSPATSAIADVHFRIEGPVVRQIVQTFAEDWEFCCSERLAGAAWFPPLTASGPVLARAIAAGPDESFERIRWLILAVLAQARQRVRIVTPYFLPDLMLASALTVAALRGVVIDIVLPGENNLLLVQWASHAKLAPLLARGVRVFRTPPPFDHAKLMTADGAWSMVGSANWDARSLRLNFELNIACCDAGLAGRLDRLIDERIAKAQPLSLADLEGRPLAIRLRDGLAWLLSPYL